MQFHNAADAFVGLLADVRRQGRLHSSRVGQTQELLHQTVTLRAPLERVIVLPERRNDVFASIAETLWVIAGRSDVEFLKHYVPRAPEFSDDGTVWRAGYGPRIRSWSGTTDQLRNTVTELAHAPGSRRAVISLFDPATDMTDTLDVPCTDWLQFIERDGVLSLAVTVRSNDLIWGFSGINTFEWSVLQEMVAFWRGAQVGPVTYFIGSLHTYDRHFDRVDKILAARPGADPYVAPAATRFATPLDQLDDALTEWFLWEQQIRTGTVTAEDIPNLRDPLLADFLHMIQARTLAASGQLDDAVTHLSRVDDPALVAAALDVLAWKYGVPAAAAESAKDSLGHDIGQYVTTLHRSKTADYGNSWKKRGETFSILPNIDRKIDRLLVLESKDAAVDESTLDTTVDLFVYALKYKTYLLDESSHPFPTGTWSDGTDGLETLLADILAEPRVGDSTSVHTAEATIDSIERAVHDGAGLLVRLDLCEQLIRQTWNLVVATVRADEGAAYREFAKERRRSNQTVGA